MQHWRSHTCTHTLVWATMSSTSSPPWTTHLTIRAAESTCAHVLVFVRIAMPVLPPVACYLSERVKPWGRQGCGDGPVATAARSRGGSKWVIAARHSGRDSTSSSVSSPRHHRPWPLIFCMSLPSEALSPQTTTELPPYPWKSFSLFYSASLLCPSLAIKQSSSFISAPSSSSSSPSLNSLSQSVGLGVWSECENRKYCLCVDIVVLWSAQIINTPTYKKQGLDNSCCTSGLLHWRDQTLLCKMPKWKWKWQK